jgi:hypothetical protein
MLVSGIPSSGSPPGSLRSAARNALPAVTGTFAVAYWRLMSAIVAM